MFAILFQFICCWPSWKSKTTTRVRPLSQADRARQLYVTLSARAHSLTLSHTLAVSRQFSVAWVQYSQTSSYTDDFVCLCASIFCACIARAKGAWWCMCSLLCLYLCVRYTHICQPLDLQRLRCAYESGQSVLFNVHLATIHKLYQVLQRRMTDIV